MNKDHWNIFDLPQETKGIDWLGVSLVIALIAAIVLIIK